MTLTPVQKIALGAAVLDSDGIRAVLEPRLLAARVGVPAGELLAAFAALDRDGLLTVEVATAATPGPVPAVVAWLREDRLAALSALDLLETLAAYRAARAAAAPDLRALP